MTPVLASILSDLEIEVVDMRVRRGPGQTCATQTMERILAEHGAQHLTIVLRSIVETENNKMELVAPTIWAVSDIILAHPSWCATTAWLDAMDAIDLSDLRERAKANRQAVKARQAMATMLFEKLRETFALETQPRLV